MGYAQGVSVPSISHRELRNDSGRILREVQAGQSFIITNNGQPVAALKPIEHDPLAGIRHQPPKRGARFADIKPEKGNSDESTLDALMYLRGER
jgi:prevent-host-death family protein